MVSKLDSYFKDMLQKRKKIKDKIKSKPNDEM